LNVAKQWPAGSEARVQPISGGAMLYDASRASNAQPGWLDAGWWAQRGSVTPAAAGRGAVSLIDADARQLVLRHYRRGGLMARLSSDRYWWSGARAVRSFCEWQLLYLMRRYGLPVPTPIAAGYRRAGLSYSADLLMERIVGARTLAECLIAAPLPITQWVAVGRCLRRFHVAGVCHADLNAHNVLFDANEQVWVIDFDRATLRAPGMWSDANLARLYRSIEKVVADYPVEHFSNADWVSLLGGYLAPSSDVPPAQ
jgi:3-deoxy-D-manno-octulosonic acid kinase